MAAEIEADLILCQLQSVISNSNLFLRLSWNCGVIGLLAISKSV